MLYLAIDQHSKQLTVNVRDESGQIVQRKQVSTRSAAPREFLEQLSQRAGVSGYAAIVEVCGFNDWLLDLLPHCGCRETVLVQPGEPGKRKTDRRDANQLGEVLWVNRHRLLAGQRIQGLRRVNIPGVQEREHRRLAALKSLLLGAVLLAPWPARAALQQVQSFGNNPSNIAMFIYVPARLASPRQLPGATTRRIGRAL